MPATYAVIGNPIAHSRSPQIHAAFAKQTGQDIVYDRLLAAVDGFAAAVDAFRATGGAGANVTLPFKLDAFDYVDRRSGRAEAAGAVNTMVFDGRDALGDNTDGAGLVTDLERNQGLAIAGARVLLLGAGGAVRGVILPLLGRGPARLVVANRTADKARDLAQHFARWGEVIGCGFADLAGGKFDLVVDAWTKTAAPGELADVRVWWVKTTAADQRSPMSTRAKKYVEIEMFENEADAWTIELRGDRKEFRFEVEVDARGRAQVFTDIVTAEGRTVRHCRATTGNLRARRLLGIPIGIDSLSVECVDDRGRDQRGHAVVRKLRR